MDDALVSFVAGVVAAVCGDAEGGSSAPTVAAELKAAPDVSERLEASFFRGR